MVVFFCCIVIDIDVEVLWVELSKGWWDVGWGIDDFISVRFIVVMIGSIVFDVVFIREFLVIGEFLVMVF